MSASKLPKKPQSKSLNDPGKKPFSSKRGAKKGAGDPQAKVNKDLEGFQIGINTFGEISSNFTVERINTFLNKNVPDRRLGEAEPDRDEDSSPDLPQTR